MKIMHFLLEEGWWKIRNHMFSDLIGDRQLDVLPKISVIRSHVIIRDRVSNRLFKH